MAGKDYMYLTTEVDVPTGEEKKKETDPLPSKRVQPGILADSGLTDEQIEKLPRGSTRPATADEIEAAQNSAKARDAAKVAADAEEQRKQDEIVRANEKKDIASKAEADKNAPLAEVEQRHADERAAHDEETTAKLNETQSPDAPAKSSRRTKDNS